MTMYVCASVLLVLTSVFFFSLPHYQNTLVSTRRGHVRKTFSAPTKIFSANTLSGHLYISPGLRQTSPSYTYISYNYVTHTALLLSSYRYDVTKAPPLKLFRLGKCICRGKRKFFCVFSNVRVYV